MSSPGRLPTSLAQLGASGILDAIFQRFLLEGGAAAEEASPGLLSGLVDRFAPWLTPSQHYNVINATLKQQNAAFALEAIGDTGKLRISDIPLIAGRNTARRDLTGRFVYRVSVGFEVRPGAFRYVTVYVESGDNLTLGEVRDRAFSEAVAGLFPRRGSNYYREVWAETDQVAVVESVQRSS